MNEQMIYVCKLAESILQFSDVFMSGVDITINIS